MVRKFLSDFAAAQSTEPLDGCNYSARDLVNDLVAMDEVDIEADAYFASHAPSWLFHLYLKATEISRKHQALAVIYTYPEYQVIMPSSGSEFYNAMYEAWQAYSGMSSEHAPILQLNF